MENISKVIGVYIKIDSQNNITDIDSGIFIKDTTDWIKIDEGIGDKYALAQSNYLAKPIVNINGKYNYIYKSGRIIEV